MNSVAIMGAGSALKDFLSILPSHIRVAGLGDNSAELHGTTVEGHTVRSVEDLAELNADHYVITARAVDAMREQLVQLGVAADRISAFYCSYSGELSAKVNADIERLNRELGLGLPPAGIATMYMWPDAPVSEHSSPIRDFVRVQTIRLVAERIIAQEVPGSIAELGVYQGEMAALLNRLFPTRTLHLFDTFEGFSEQDLSSERTANFSKAVGGEFHNTSVDLVLSRLQDSSVAEVHKGFFPDTAAGVEDRFALVSLDVDLFRPTLAGLEYFYPRLSSGGAIFVHDYNNRRYLGVRNAVDGFLRESGACALPLPDFAGSIVILKP